VGGLVGENNCYITASCSTGAVVQQGDGIGDTGGLVGLNKGVIIMSYSTGTITGKRRVGGLVGTNGEGGNVTSSFWDIETSGQATSAEGTGLTTAEMQDINTFKNAGWDLIGEIFNGTCDYWHISPSDYPSLCYHNGDSPVMPVGLGTAQEPYLIRDVRDLGTVWFKPLAHYSLEASVDLSGIMWSLAVVPWFGGSFDGNGHTISNLTIAGVSYLGLFGQLGSEANISNLGLEAMEVNGTGAFVGGLVGMNYGGGITTSHGSGTVIGSSSVGGLAGHNAGSITESYSTGTATGGGYVGGLVGYNRYGSITRSYCTGVVSGEAEVGGLVGMNLGIVAASYSASAVTGHENVGGLVGHDVRATFRPSIFGSTATSFWDMETSSQTTSAGGIGKTTAEMQTASTFLEAGWDFVGETDNGTDDIWWILEGQNYPRLWWEQFTRDALVLVVDDFESYTVVDAPDPAGNYIFDTWIDGFGTITNGAIVGYDLMWADPAIVHGGNQAMPYYYNNNLKTSEATRTLVSLLDWTQGGVTELSLWFRGYAANSPERMFVALDGTAVVYHEDPAATQLEGWNEWVINLQAFADQGVDLANVNTITIGLGTKNSGVPGPGGTGRMYFDDIRLYRR